MLFIDNMVLPEGGDSEGVDLQPHLGLCSLSAVLREGGRRARIWDPKAALYRGQLVADESLYHRASAIILDLEPEVVGFTALGSSMLFALRVALLLKQARPDLPILLGGPHASILHREILERFDCFDVVVRHEAERTLPQVLDRLAGRDLAEIPGVSWRQGGQVRVNPGAPRIDDLDALPLPDFSDYDIAGLGLDELRIDAGRGCPFSCTFCSTADFFGRTYRIKSAERLVQELDLLHTRYGLRHFNLNHDLFTVNKKKVLEFCYAVQSRGYRWSCSARVDCVDEALLEAMAASGCASVYFGIETGSQRMQRITEKRLTLELLDPTLDKIDALGMSCTASYVTGYPEEEQADLDATLDQIGSVWRRDGARFRTQLHMLVPEPGTQLIRQHGGALRFDGYVNDYNSPTFDARDPELVRTHADIFSTYFHFPSAVDRDRLVFSIEAYLLLRLLGSVVLHHVLQQFAGRLSQLIAALWEARHSTRMDGPQEHEGAAGPIDAGNVVRFFLDRFGPGHYLSSLVRCGLVVERVQTRGPRRRLADRYDGDLSKQLSPTAFHYWALHDCMGIVNTLRERPDQPLPTRVTERVSDYLVLAQPHQGTSAGIYVTLPMG